MVQVSFQPIRHTSGHKQTHVDLGQHASKVARAVGGPPAVGVVDAGQFDEGDVIHT